MHLIEDHFLIIIIYRDYYHEYQIAPSMRVSVKMIKNKCIMDECIINECTHNKCLKSKTNSYAYLEKLFTHSNNKSNPRSLNHTIIKYSGLPKPTYYEF